MRSFYTVLRLSKTAITLLLCTGLSAQVLWLEEFDGGASTTGFTIDQNNVTDCRWEYAPDSVGIGDFSLDFSGAWPAGPGFDSSFVFLDSDACGGTDVTVQSFLYSAPFSATAPGIYTLAFAQQFRARLESFTSVSVSPDGGTTWTEVQHQVTTDVGYPNPSIVSTVDITSASAASANAQLRFEFNAAWDWWWAVDSISVTYTDIIGIDEFAALPRLNVGPNPTSDVLRILSPMQAGGSMRVLDVLGRPVMSRPFARSLDISGLASGSYTLLALDTSGSPVGSVRFVKE